MAYAVSPAGSWTMVKPWSGSRSTSNIIKKLLYANGYWIGAGTSYSSSGGYQACVGWAATSPEAANWSSKTLWTSGAVECFTYANGKYVACGWYKDSDTGMFYERIMYSTSRNFNSYTTIDFLPDAGDKWTLKDITYADGFWTIVGSYNKTKGYLLYSPTLDGFEKITI